MGNLEIWRRAIPLSQAEQVFAPASLVRKARRKPKNLKRQLGGIKVNENVASFSDAFDQFSAGMTQIQHQLSTRIEIRDCIIRWLAEARLLAYGYQNPNELPPEPTQIPIYMFDQNSVDWVHSTVKAFGHHFVHVRLISVSEVSTADKEDSSPEPHLDPNPIVSALRRQPEDQTALQKTKGRGRGRPSKKMDILVELVCLLSEQGRLSKQLRKQQIATVQTSAIQNFPSIFFKEPGRNTVLEALKRAGVID